MKLLNMACGRQLCAQLAAILVLYLLISNVNNSGESLWHSRYVDCDAFYAAATVPKAGNSNNNISTSSVN